MIGGWSNPGIVVTPHTRDPSVPKTAPDCSREIVTRGSGVSGVTKIERSKHNSILATQMKIIRQCTSTQKMHAELSLLGARMLSVFIPRGTSEYTASAVALVMCSFED